MMEYNNIVGGVGLGMGLLGTWLGVFMLPLLVWSIVWKGLALWKAARSNSPVWFVVLLVVNTLGILEILYIYVFSSNKKLDLGTSTAKRLPAKKRRK